MRGYILKVSKWVEWKNYDGGSASENGMEMGTRNESESLSYVFLVKLRGDFMYAAELGSS